MSFVFKVRLKELQQIACELHVHLLAPEHEALQVLLLGLYIGYPELAVEVLVEGAADGLYYMSTHVNEDK